MAGGQLTDEVARDLIRHAASCAACGRLLRGATDDLQDEAGPGDDVDLSALASSRPDWQRRLADQIVSTGAGSTRHQTGLREWWTASRLAFAGVAFLALAIAAYRIEFRHSQQETVSELLAHAAGARRFSAMRMQGAGYAPLGEGVSRAPESTFLSSPGELLKAEALIFEQLGKHPSDPFWLQAKARADLLDGKHGAAQATLIRALQLDPQSAAIRIDLAIAYFEQKNYSSAYEELSRVLAATPDNPVALFNRAVVAEQQFLYRQALEDWEHYLAVDGGSAWAEEARQRAEALHKKLEMHDQSRAVPLLSPAELADLSQQPALRARVDARVGEYLDEAVKRWLPRAYPEARQDVPDTSARSALFFLADLTSREHGDTWLVDLLRGTGASQFPAAVAALADSASANSLGDFDQGLRQAKISRQMFESSRNRAGSLRARFEQAYAYQILREAKSCRTEGGSALADSEPYPYHWLHVQLGLEHSLCTGLNGNLGADQRGTQLAVERARLSGYNALLLRALGFAADDRLEAGDPAGSLRLAGAGLQRFWSGDFPDLRGFNLYTQIASIAGTSRQPQLELAAWREAVALIDHDPDLAQRAVTHATLARAALSVGQDGLAQQEFEKSARLYSQAPQTEGIRRSRTELEIGIAKVEARQQRFEDALKRLTALQDVIRESPDRYMALKFYATLGEIQLRRGLPAQAEQTLWTAADLSEAVQASLKSEDTSSRSPDADLALPALAEAGLVQGRELESLEIYEWYLNGLSRRPAGVARLHSAPPPVQLAQRLPLLQHATVLTYGVLTDGLAIWASDNRGVHGWFFPGAGDTVQQVSSRFHELLSSPRSEMRAVQRDARALYQLLIAPVESVLSPDRTLVIESDGALSELPFEALLDANGHYLLERMAMTHSLGENTDVWAHPPAPVSASEPALIVASTASSQAEGLIQLPDVTAEADAVAAHFPSRLVLKGADATMGQIKPDLRDAAVFHFAGHSMLTPETSGLLLLDGSGDPEATALLDADSLRGMRFHRLQLAVLSACSTTSGLGGSRGFNGVTGALLHAGVPHVVASRWPVDSALTRMLIEDYYQHLLAGHSVSESMRQSARKLLADPRTAHPFYWSAFAAYGRP